MNYYFLIGVAAVLLPTLLFLLTLKLQKKSAVTAFAAELPARPEFIRVAGRTIVASDWTPEFLEAIRKEYFRPSVKEKHLVVLDLSATCPRTHATRDRIAIIAKDLAASKDLSAGILRSRAELQCGECGKRAKISGKSVVWEGPAETWDGAL